MTIPAQADPVAIAIYALAASVDRIAEGLAANTAALQAARQAPTSNAPPMAAAAPSGPPTAASAPFVEERMGKKVYAICRQNEWDIADIGQRVTGRPIGADSRKWSRADLSAVLDQMKDWGYA